MRNMTLILLLALSFSCKSDGLLLSPQEALNAPLMAKIFNGQNRAQTGALIELTDSKGRQWQVQTDITGKAFFPPLPWDIYEVKIWGEAMETVYFTLDYHSPDQSLYGRIYQFDELLQETQKAMDMGHWDTAEEFLLRAEALEQDKKLCLWYRSLLDWQLEEYIDVKNSLTQLIQLNGPSAAEVYLLLADVEQFKLDNPSGALEPLKEYLDRHSDRNAAQRLEALENQLEE